MHKLSKDNQETPTNQLLDTFIPFCLPSQRLPDPNPPLQQAKAEPVKGFQFAESL